ncbi:hypothetical protein B7494_g2205 [Chlorociboria aeruginascens]|nr:hypothetical protein B7494_g2205 [Chlorociboria aeruginascens]
MSEEYGNTIRKENSYDADSFTYVPVCIIGAGESGIAMGCRLREVLAFDQFRIFDRQSGIGGTWYINRYPGVACDIPAIFYSFSFCPNYKWTTFYPSGPEIVQYLQGVCEHYEIVDKIQLNTDVRECRFLESEEVWEIKLQHLVAGAGDLSEYDRAQKIRKEGPGSVYVYEETVRAKVLVSAVGGLVEPRAWPDNIVGKDRFEGEIFHSARWRYDVDLKDKDVVVVGTGCSAAQFVPQLAEKYGAKSVTQLMRSPPWVVPRITPPGGQKTWEKWSPWLSTHIPGFNKLMRLAVFAKSEYDWRLFGSQAYHEKERKILEADLLKYMEKQVPKKYHEILTPNYSVGCKRRIFDAAWLPALNDPRMELTTLPLTNIAEKSVTLGPSHIYPDPKDTTSSTPSSHVTIPADVIILANGYEITKWLHPLKIIGRGGKDLHEVFKERGGPQLYMGMAMDGFPSAFVLTGPNTLTGHSSVILASENIVNLSLKFIKPILNGDVRTVEIKKGSEIEWATTTQAALKKRVWNAGGCRSWYATEDGWNSTVYPSLMAFSAVFGIFLLRNAAKEKDMKSVLKDILRGMLFKAAEAINLGLSPHAQYIKNQRVYAVPDLVCQTLYGHAITKLKFDEFWVYRFSSVLVQPVHGIVRHAMLSSLRLVLVEALGMTQKAELVVFISQDLLRQRGCLQFHLKPPSIYACKSNANRKAWRASLEKYSHVLGSASPRPSVQLDGIRLIKTINSIFILKRNHRGFTTKTCHVAKNHQYGTIQLAFSDSEYYNCNYVGLKDCTSKWLHLKEDFLTCYKVAYVLHLCLDLKQSKF